LLFHGRDRPGRTCDTRTSRTTGHPLDGTDEAGALTLVLGPALGVRSGVTLGSSGEAEAEASGEAEAEASVGGARPVDTAGVGVPLVDGLGVPVAPVEPPPSEVPLPGSFLTTAATGLPAISSAAVTTPIARTNTRPVVRA
jgi:hypothetical protein